MLLNKFIQPSTVNTSRDGRRTHSAAGRHINWRLAYPAAPNKQVIRGHNGTTKACIGTGLGKRSDATQYVQGIELPLWNRWNHSSFGGLHMRCMWAGLPCRTAACIDLFTGQGSCFPLIGQLHSAERCRGELLSCLPHPCLPCSIRTAVGFDRPPNQALRSIHRLSIQSICWRL